MLAKGGFKSMLKDNPPPSGPPSGVRFESRIGVQAPAASLWAHLIDFNAWPEWAQIYTDVTGSFVYGGRMTMTQTLASLPPRRIDAKIIDWEPEAQIVWRDTPQIGVFTTRYFEITALSDTGCIFTSGEIVSGLLAAHWLKPRGYALRTAIEAQTVAFKAHVEAGVCHPEGRPQADTEGSQG